MAVPDQSPSLAREDVLRLEHVSKHFGPVTALRDIDLHLGKGEVLGLLGDNGAGKSTLIKVVSGVFRPDGGHIALGGTNVSFDSPMDARSAGVPLFAAGAALLIASPAPLPGRPGPPG